MDLPEYSNAKVLGEKLRYAINNCVSIDADNPDPNDDDSDNENADDNYDY